MVGANRAFQRPRIPAASAGFLGYVHQLHGHDSRNPRQLPDGAVLVMGAGQITEDLMAAGREVHLSVSACANWAAAASGCTATSRERTTASSL